MVLFAGALLIGAAYTRAFERSGAPPEPWARELSAAIAFACGHGYVDPGYAPSPTVAAFLDKRVDSVPCDAIATRGPFQSPNFTQRLYRYMTLAVGLVWWIFGVSWLKLSILFGVLYGVSAVAVYGLFRLAADRALATAGALTMIASPLQLKYLPQLRDYAKAPFILTLILILGALVVRPFSRRRALTLAAAYGAVMGIGFGFRNDLLINVLPFVITVACFLPVPVRSHALTKLAAMLLCGAAFLVCAWPIVRAYQTGSNTGHVAVLGLMTHFDEPLGITPSVYDWGQPYDDGFVIKVVGSYAERIHHQEIVALSSEYDRMAVRYLFVIARHWPADLLIRALASVLKVVELPFQIRSYTTAAPPAVQSVWIAGFYSAWDAGLSRLGGIGVAIVAVAIAGIAGASVRVGIWVLLSLLYFAGYPALQFDARHFFFFEFVPWLAVVVVAQGTIVLVASVRGAGSRATEMASVKSWAGRAIAFAIVVTATLWGTAATLRAYQQRHVTHLLDNYVGAPGQTLTLDRFGAGDRHILLRPHELSHSIEPKVRAEYIVVDVRPRACGRFLVPVTFRYDTKEGYTDLSERRYVPAPAEDGTTQLFVPIYYSPGSYFSGIEMSEDDEACVAGARRITDLSRAAVLLNLSLPPDWRRMPLYQTLTRWERPSAPYRVRVYSWPRNLDASTLEFIDAPLPRASTLSLARTVSADNNRWSVRGWVRNSTGIVLRLPEQPVSTNAYFFARGTLYGGGLTLGVLKSQTWATTVNVTVPGEFLAIVEVPHEGAYTPAIAHFLTGINRWNDFVVTNAGWVEQR